LARRGAPTGIDRYAEKIRFAARALPRARLAVADALALPFPDASFASVLIRDLLHHLAEPRRATAEAVRVLRPGGTLLVLEPNGRNPLVALQARLVPAERAPRAFTPAPARRGESRLQVQAAEAGLPAGAEQPLLRREVGLGEPDLVALGEDRHQQAEAVPLSDPAEIRVGAPEAIPVGRDRCVVEAQVHLLHEPLEPRLGRGRRTG